MTRFPNEYATVTSKQLLQIQSAKLANYRPTTVAIFQTETSRRHRGVAFQEKSFVNFAYTELLLFASSQVAFEHGAPNQGLGLVPKRGPKMGSQSEAGPKTAPRD